MLRKNSDEIRYLYVTPNQFSICYGIKSTTYEFGFYHDDSSAAKLKYDNLASRLNDKDKLKTTKYNINGHEVLSSSIYAPVSYFWKQDNKYFFLHIIESPHKDEYLELCDPTAYPLNLTTLEKIDTPSFSVEFLNAMDQAESNLVVSFFKSNSYNDSDLLYKGTANLKGIIGIPEDLLSSQNKIYMRASKTIADYTESQDYILDCDNIKKQTKFDVKWIPMNETQKDSIIPCKIDNSALAKKYDIKLYQNDLVTGVTNLVKEKYGPVDTKKISISDGINVYTYTDGWGYKLEEDPIIIGSYDYKAVLYRINAGFSTVNLEAIDGILEVDDEIALVDAGNKTYLKSPLYTTMLTDDTWIVGKPDIEYTTQDVANFSGESLVCTKMHQSTDAKTK